MLTVTSRSFTYFEEKMAWFDDRLGKCVYKIKSYYTTWQPGQGIILECAYQTNKLTHKLVEASS